MRTLRHVSRLLGRYDAEKNVTVYSRSGMLCRWPDILPIDSELFSGGDYNLTVTVEATPVEEPIEDKIKKDLVSSLQSASALLLALGKEEPAWCAGARVAVRKALKLALRGQAVPVEAPSTIPFLIERLERYRGELYGSWIAGDAHELDRDLREAIEHLRTKHTRAAGTQTVVDQLKAYLAWLKEGCWSKCSPWAGENGMKAKIKMLRSTIELLQDQGA